MAARKTQGKKRNSTSKKNTSANRKGSAKKMANTKTKNSPLTREITFLVLLVFSILSLLSLFHVCGIFGEALSSFLFGLMGALAYVFPIYLIVAAGLYIANTNNKKLRHKIIFSAGLFWCLCALFEWVVNEDVKNVGEIYTLCSSSHGGGGFFGGLLSFFLTKALGRAGSMIVILALFILFFMLISGKLFFSSLQQLYKEREEREEYVEYTDAADIGERQMNTYKFDKEERKEEKAKTAPKKKKKKQTGNMEEVLPEPTLAETSAEAKQRQDMSDIHIIRSTDTPSPKPSTMYEEELTQKFGAKTSSEIKPEIEPENKLENKPETRPEIKRENKPKSKPEKATVTKEDEKEMAQVQAELEQASMTELPYEFPPLSLLSAPNGSGSGIDNEELRATAMKLQETLESFGVRIRMGDISLGPSVTRYELIPEQGVKVSKITSLSDDIKLSLAASDIRIEAPIPGKAAVGIEVPNPKRQTITLRELMESSEFTKAKSKVTFAVGKDISGKTIVTDIAKMPHLLIAGATGSGKSVLINTLIMSILYKANPNEVKLIMVDPKMVELTAYEDIPHLMIPVVKDPKKASAALSWAVAEMTGRYQKFADTGVRDIKSYNAKINKLTNKDDPEYQKMPQIVIIVDEFADLMMVAPGEVEDSVCRLAQLARAAGIHLVLATQRPSVNVITGLIKANIPSRIALSVSSAVDSRTIIDSAGAEKLLGNGDMLFAPQNLPKPIRVQGAFVSDEERDGVVSFLKNSSNGPAYNEEVTKHIETAPVPGAKNGGDAAGDTASSQDQLFAEAGMFIIEKDKASIGLLQRMFRIGFNRAARIMDQLAEAGVVGPEEGTKARQILMSREQFENYLEENG